MLARGVTVGLGTDGCASNNALDLFREMDIFAKLHKLSRMDATALPAREALRAATTANAELLGLPGLGYLAVGNVADLILLDVQAPHLTPLYTPDLLVYAASGSDVHSTMIGGRMVVEKRQILSFDLAETMARVRKMAAKLTAK
jgi:5-methylthioadenosine/S-adenosylhomocysteine deaminase